jgi:quercetin dioxygenase-like cupin family protein
VTLIRVDEPGREFVKVGKADGATRVWICSGQMAKDSTVGLHRHGGDEIFQVLKGTVRFHVDGENIDVGPGHYVVVPPYTEHGFRILTDDAELQFVGEIEMGEWVTVIEADGSVRQVEIRSEMMPWHRRPLEGEEFDFMGMLTMLGSTSHLLDHGPSDPHPHTHDSPDSPEEGDHPHAH